MDICTLFALIVAVFIFQISCNVSPKYQNNIKIVTPEATIYGTNELSPEDKIAWSDHPDWSALPDLLYDFGLLEIGLLCVRGSWLLYDKPYYEVNVEEKHTYTLLTGEQICTKPGYVGSMQPIGSQGVIDESSLTYFHKPNFASKANSLTREWSFKGLMQDRKIASLITIGNDSWTIMVQCEDTSSPRTKCIHPDPVYGSDEYPICSLSTLTGTGLESTCNVLTSVKMGCESSISAADTITISECRPFDYSNYVQAQSTTTVPTTPRSVTENKTEVRVRARKVEVTLDMSQMLTCKADGTTNDDMANLLRFLKLRRENDFEEEPMIVWTNNNADSFKSDLVDATFDIAIKVCPELAVAENFLHMSRELFMSELHDVWRASSSPEVNMEDMEFVLFQMRKCSILLDENGDTDELQSRTFEAMTDTMSDEDEEELEVNYQRPMTSNTNLVMDVAWLAANLVSTICHKTLHFTNNFWFQYVEIFTKTYLEPLAKANVWNNANMANKRFEFIMSGYGLKEQYNGFAKCTSEAVNSVPNMNPFRKPI